MADVKSVAAVAVLGLYIRPGSRNYNPSCTFRSLKAHLLSSDLSESNASANGTTCSINTSLAIWSRNAVVNYYDKISWHLALYGCLLKIPQVFQTAFKSHICSFSSSKFRVGVSHCMKSFFA